MPVGKIFCSDWGDELVRTGSRALVVVLTTSSWLVRLLDVRVMLLVIMMIGVLDIGGDGKRITAQITSVQLGMTWIKIGMLRQQIVP